ncbi:hypothetical protein CCY99_07430 [Helicobacter sp. 16-1353]|uniref:hypothetical protein n=1 Tax=Helicobacter sp. 16-1353 TaxID=2004996 RepID=UPI000DCD4D98|nr:hypothetical protein [Helicobacter sp. 16-1353]RAX52469.1 hypothetical protein CCY99_07430 [Helicobacter sp. 16-1353]
MQKFCFFCVTYAKDFRNFTRMIESFNRHNRENIPFIIALQDERIYAEPRIKTELQAEAKNDIEIVSNGGGQKKLENPPNPLNSVKNQDSTPNINISKLDSANYADSAPNINIDSSQDSTINLDSKPHSATLALQTAFLNILQDFKQYENSNIKIILDSDFAKDYLITHSPPNSLKAGYLNQEIAKLAFFESNIAEHYLCIDSDTIFIRDFGMADFFADSLTPYIVLCQDKDLHSTSYYEAFAKERLRGIKRIFDFIDLADLRLRTCHNSQIFSSKILRSFKSEIMEKNHLTYADLMAISPFEFSWYSAYFQKCKLIKEVQIEPFFKMYHTKAEYALDRLSSRNLEHLKSQYIGVILNSNWAGNMGFESGGKLNKMILKILFFLIKKFIC